MADPSRFKALITRPGAVKCVRIINEGVLPLGGTTSQSPSSPPPFFPYPPPSPSPPKSHITPSSPSLPSPSLCNSSSFATTVLHTPPNPLQHYHQHHHMHHDHLHNPPLFPLSTIITTTLLSSNNNNNPRFRRVNI